MNFDLVLFMNRKLNYENLSLPFSILICIFMGSFYVITLYLWSKQNRYNRNEPSVIKRRFISVFFTSIVCFIILSSIGKVEIGHSTSNSHSINKWLGFNLDFELIKSSFITLVLTIILFIGPIVQNFLSVYLFSLNFQAYDDCDNEVIYDTNNNNYYKRSGVKKLEENKGYSSTGIYLIQQLYESIKLKLKKRIDVLFNQLNDLCFWRSYIISPFTEEFVFRSCMLPLLLPHLGLAKLILVTPLFFGLAHLHHIIEGAILNEAPIEHLIAEHLFQFIYTYIFGIYSSFLFLRTGNFFSSFVSHSFCNVMGFPNIRQLFTEFEFKFKMFLSAMYVLGLICFFSLINPLTQPSYFNNNVFLF